ncbi:phenylalanine--tRNA ligase subunit beta [Candidatus Woesearchaeota archaeon]|nr:phenylalanine--tRNA ligase subunit beta [Candidatus Woesearchaeota archaeon]
MPTITLNKRVFEELVGKKLPLEQLKDRISMLGTDLEKIEGNEIVVEIFPNRPDMLSESGFARAFSSFIGVKTGLRQYEVKDSGQKVIIEPSVKDVRPYTACAIVKNMNLDDEKIQEIIQIQEKLHLTYGRNRKKAAIGIYPLDKISFPISYRAEVSEQIRFWPLDSTEVMTASKILTEHKAGKEYGHLLTGQKKYPLFRDALGEILSMPPVINSHFIGRVTPETQAVFIECSGFDFRVLSICLNIIVTALADQGGKILSVALEYGKNTEVTPQLHPMKMKLDLAYINARLGLKLSEKEAAALLARMGYGYEHGTVLVPAYRADILHQVDLMEDLAIAYGYENFEEEIPQVSTIGEEDNLEKFCRKVREALMGLGLLEVKNYHLLMEEQLNQNMNCSRPLISLKNAVGEHNHLRNALLPGLLKNLAENQHHQYPQNLFEVGKIFQRGKTDTGVKEITSLAMVLCHEKTDFTEMRQLLDALMVSLGLKAVIKESQHPSFIEGRLGTILVNGTEIGVMGEIHPAVLVNWELTVPVVALEIDLEKISAS